ncbi:hypothetical protein, partial [Burkholderia vietnamiensis]|uniref:hypothetical protein n=1 Tax=Burkholderia vietnamiensis TaxID=60552 RepID=UPI001CF382AE
VLASRPFRASLSSAQDHEHDISNAPLATPVYTVSNFNSLLGPLEGEKTRGVTLFATTADQSLTSAMPDA